MSDEIFDALKKCAVGFSSGETVEEYAAEDGALKLIKKKVTRRFVPPDIKAVKMLMDDGGISGLTDAALEEEKDRLMKMLEECDD